MSLQRQQFLLSYSKTLSVGPAGVWTRDLAPAQETDTGGFLLDVLLKDLFMYVLFYSFFWFQWKQEFVQMRKTKSGRLETVTSVTAAIQ